MVPVADIRTILVEASETAKSVALVPFLAITSEKFLVVPLPAKS